MINAERASNMKTEEFNKIKEGDRLKLNFASSKEFRGRFNSYDYYIVRFTRSGKMIHDDSGQCRFLHDIYKHFHRHDKWT